MRFTLFDRRKKLVISVLISFISKSVYGSKVYTTLGISNRAKKNYYVKNSLQQLYHFCLIIDEVSMINLSLLASIDIQL